MTELLEFEVPEYPIQKENIICEELEGVDEVIFVDEQTGNNYAMNRMAAVIINLCDGEHTVDHIAQIIHETLQGDLDVIRTDTRAVLAEFSAYGLIHGKL